MNAYPRVRCSNCGGACKRLVGAGAGIIFKGSGFYETDYRRKNASTDKSESKPEVKEVKTEKKAESKPATTD